MLLVNEAVYLDLRRVSEGSWHCRIVVYLLLIAKTGIGFSEKLDRQCQWGFLVTTLGK